MTITQESHQQLSVTKPRVTPAGHEAIRSNLTAAYGDSDSNKNFLPFFVRSRIWCNKSFDQGKLHEFVASTGNVDENDIFIQYASVYMTHVDVDQPVTWTQQAVGSSKTSHVCWPPSYDSRASKSCCVVRRVKLRCAVMFFCGRIVV